MKVKIYSLFIIGILMLIPPSFGQKTVVVVEPDAGLEVGALNAAIAAAELGGTAANTIFELKRNGLYLLNGDISHIGYTLHIRGQEGAGSKPVLQPGVDINGASERQFTISGNLILEHVYLQGRNELGAIDVQPIRLSADGLTVIIDDCVLDYSGQSFVRTSSKHNKIYIKNSVLRNCINPSDPANGRIIDSRGNANDTLWISNCTTYNNSATQLRSDGGATLYANFDHNTVYQSSFGHLFALDYIYKAKVTNNVFYNFLYRGDNTGHSQFFSCDSIFSTTLGYNDAGRQFDLSNNNWFTQKEIGDIMDQYGIDTLFRFQPWDVAPYDTIWYRQALRKNWFASDSLLALNLPGDPPDMIGFIKNGQVDTTNLFREELTFKNPPPLNLDYWKFYTEHNGSLSGTNPPNAFANEDPLVLGEVQTGAFDFSYNSNSRSATAADGGLPLGASRWVPFASVSVRDVKIDQKNGVRTFPNPFESKVNFKIDSKKASKITIQVFDLLGKELYTEKGNVTQGENEISVNLDKLSHRGLFLYKIQFESSDGMKSISSGKLLKK